MKEELIYWSMSSRASQDLQRSANFSGNFGIFALTIKLLFEIVKSSQVGNGCLVQNPGTIGPVNVVTPESKHLQAFLVTIMTKFNTRKQAFASVSGDHHDQVQHQDWGYFGGEHSRKERHWEPEQERRLDLGCHSATGTLTVATGSSRNVIVGSTNKSISAMIALIGESNTLSHAQTELVFKVVAPSSSVCGHDERLEVVEFGRRKAQGGFKVRRLSLLKIRCHSRRSRSDDFSECNESAGQRICVRARGAHINWQEYEYFVAGTRKMQ